MAKKEKKNLIDRAQSGELYQDDNGKLSFESHCGSHIKTVFEHVCVLANAYKESIQLEFNGVKYTVEPNSDFMELSAAYTKKIQDEHEAYLNSPAYKKLEKKAEVEAKQLQIKMDILIHDLKEIVKHEGRLMNWLKIYSEIADNSRVASNPTLVISLLEGQGYKDGDNVIGEFISEKEKNKLRRLLQTNKTELAKWVLGQAINCMKRGMAPHPMLTHKFVDEYNQIS